MTLQLTQKERTLLQDQQSHEQLCIQQYKKNAQKATDPQLKQLFETIAQHEQQHLNTVNSILAGQVPAMNQGSQQQQTSPAGQSQTASSSTSYNQNDAFLCQELLMAEKYISGVYNTAIFEMTQPAVRQALNHIQKEEQEHGEQIYKYMSSHGMYSTSS